MESREPATAYANRFPALGRRRATAQLLRSTLLIGLLLWIAENLATRLEAWQYPAEAEAWQWAHVAKIGSWALLVTMSFVLVAAVKAQEGRLYHPPNHPPPR